MAAPEKGGHEVLAAEPIAAGTLIAMWSGRLIPGDQLEAVPAELVHRVAQVEEDLYLVSIAPMEGADMINHSCAPNAGLSGQIGIVAMRDIEAGEEITIDYAMCDGTSYDEFPCACGTPTCRGMVRGEDWKRPELQRRYEGYFSPYLARRIARLPSLAVIDTEAVTEDFTEVLAEVPIEATDLPQIVHWIRS